MSVKVFDDGSIATVPNPRTRVYLAGPMRGIPEFNFPAFTEAARELRDAGFEVFNPAERDQQNGFDPTGLTGNEDLNDGVHRFDLRDALGADLDWITRNADVIALLPGWERSKGVRAELATAAALGLRAGTMFDLTRGGHGVVAGDLLATLEALEAHDRAVEALGPQGSEVRITSSTGGEKGQKLARFDLLPADALWQVAEHYGKGAKKYAARNWERGYDWSLSFGAAMRHAWAFWNGEDIDPETGSHHMAAFVFHGLTMLTFASTHPVFDDRPSTAAKREEVA